MLVYRAATKNTFVHREPDCSRLLAKVKGDVRQVELADVAVPRFCSVCFPNAPVLRSVHRLCRVCEQSRPLPCPHNGAVQVWVPQVDATTKIPWIEPNRVVRHKRWVWPEKAMGYTLVDQSILG